MTGTVRNRDGGLERNAECRDIDRLGSVLAEEGSMVVAYARLAGDQGTVNWERVGDCPSIWRFVEMHRRIRSRMGADVAVLARFHYVPCILPPVDTPLVHEPHSVTLAMCTRVDPLTTVAHDRTAVDPRPKADSKSRSVSAPGASASIDFESRDDR